MMNFVTSVMRGKVFVGIIIGEILTGGANVLVIDLSNVGNNL